MLPLIIFTLLFIASASPRAPALGGAGGRTLSRAHLLHAVTAWLWGSRLTMLESTRLAAYLLQTRVGSTLRETMAIAAAAASDAPPATPHGDAAEPCRDAAARPVAAAAAPGPEAAAAAAAGGADAAAASTAAAAAADVEAADGQLTLEPSTMTVSSSALRRELASLRAACPAQAPGGRFSSLEAALARLAARGGLLRPPGVGLFLSSSVSFYDLEPAPTPDAGAVFAVPKAFLRTALLCGSLPAVSVILDVRLVAGQAYAAQRADARRIAADRPLGTVDEAGVGGNQLMHARRRLAGGG